VKQYFNCDKYFYPQHTFEDLGEDDVDVTKAVEKVEEKVAAEIKLTNVQKSEVKLFYTRTSKHQICSDSRKDNQEIILTASSYHKKLRILIIGILVTILALNVYSGIFIFRSIDW